MTRPRASAEQGQAAVLLVGALVAMLLGAFILGAVARGVGAAGRAQRAADLGALAGARAMHGAFSRLFAPPVLDGRPNPEHLEKQAYLQLGREAARETARRNGATGVQVSFPDATTIAPVRVRVSVRERVEVDVGERRAGTVVAREAEAELTAPGGAIGPGAAGGAYAGPLAHRQGKPMRPDVALAFDRLERAARADGVALILTSGFRSDAEQALLFARNPDPKWVARPGHSLHRMGTELDLGPPAAHAWLAANAGRFHFLRRYPWEPWHFGYTLNAGSRSAAAGGEDGSSAAGGTGGGAVPSFVPERFAAFFAASAQRWNVSAALLAAQAYAESGLNPFAVSRAGAKGIAQFMPGTARAYGLRDAFDARSAIDAQGHLMRDLLRQFGSVELALAAYNAGPAPVQRCGCVPPFTETRGYVARVLGLLGGAGELVAGGGPAVRLVR